jgi:carboxypeptidase family protein/TonB-dependent receptor-like protein
MRPLVFTCRKSLCSKLAQLLGASIAALMICAPLFSQGSQGAIQGGVFDQSGGAIAGATVTVVDVARGVARTLIADDAGQFVAVSLNPGTYTVRAEAKGFRTVEHSGVLVEVGQTIRVDLVLQPGEQSQTITVTGELPAIDTTDATLGGTVSNQDINALPLNGRNFERLLLVRPGVVTNIGSTSNQGSVTHGRRGGNDVLLVEGVSEINPSTGVTTLNSSYRIGDANSILPIDAIQEFNVEQNPKAEYGWGDGSVINVGVRSGTNSLHGTAYAYGRDASATDAANAFTHTVTPATLEQFGATAGGRIIKDKLFWFLGYEGLRTELGDVSVVTIPSDISLGDPTKSMVDACNALARNGSGGFNPVGTNGGVSAVSARLSGITIDPVTGCTVSQASSTFENVFPYNPTSSINYNPPLTTSGPLNNGFIKGDYAISPHHHVSGFYFVSKSTQIANYDFRQLLPQWEATIPSDVRVYTGSWSWTPNSAWLNDFRAGYSFLHASTFSGDADKILSAPWPQGYGINTGVTNPLYGGFPNILFNKVITGYLGTGARNGIRGPQGNLEFVDSVSYLRGKHAFKFGFDFNDIVHDNNNFDQGNGQVTFDTLQTFLQGVPLRGLVQLGQNQVFVRAHWYGAFFQDDWRVTARVTLNLGLRYEYEAPPTERFNHIGNFNPNVDPTTTPAVQQVGPGAPIARMFRGDYKAFSPRLGVAWDVRGNGKTVVRAGASMLRNAELVEQLAAGGAGGVPFGANFPSIGAGINNSGKDINAHTSNRLALSANQINWLSLAGPVFPTQPQIINGVTYTGPTCAPTGFGGSALATPCTTQATYPNFLEPGAAEWNLDIQRAITNHLMIDVAYVGTHGFHEASLEDINQPAIGAGWTTTTINSCLASTPLYKNCKADARAEVGPYSSLFPYLKSINETGNLFHSNFNALEVTGNERLSHGLTFLAGYTYSHALDQSSGQSLINAPLQTDSNNPRLFYGNSNNDIRHRFTFSPHYAIPGIKAPAQMLQGWSISAIFIAESGRPWYPQDTTTDIVGTGEFTNSTAKSPQLWNYSGPRSAFTSGSGTIPCFGPLSGCTPYPVVSGVPQLPAACLSAAQAPYAGNVQLQSLAVASLTNLGCYVQGGGVLTPPAYGTIGNANRNLFRGPSYKNVDFSVSKDWKVKERLTTQFRVEFFNIFNRADFSSSPAAQNGSSVGLDPEVAQFGCSCTSPDVANPVVGSGGPRHIQFALKLIY